MIVEEICPRCGGVIDNLMLMTYPPIPKKKCFKCGWSWVGEPEKIVRVPFQEPVKTGEHIINEEEKT